MEETNLLIILTRNPEAGKVKTRLAKTIGDDAALAIYKYLLQHTAAITENLEVALEVHYSEEVVFNDDFDETLYMKKKQAEGDLGERMELAFASAFKRGYRHVIIIGSDVLDLYQEDLEEAFDALKTYDYVLGPSEDGGYYLLGMNSLNKKLFENKAWGTDTVLRDTLIDLREAHLHLMDERNDIDDFEDIKDLEVFQPILDYLKSNN